MHFLHVVGARPNFMKVAPLTRALAARPGVRQTLVHTGQHYDRSMSDVFFPELEIPEPDFNLAVGAGTHAEQTSQIMLRFEPVVVEQKPDWVLVYGDVNSTVAAALVYAKLQIPVAHVEAGLRSFDRRMPEEINRLLTDQLADLLFTPSEDGDRNLLREGVPRERIHLVGNVMIDTLIRLQPKAAATLPADLPPKFALVTLHRLSNVDDLSDLKKLLETLTGIGGTLPIIFPVHPRTRQKIAELRFRHSENLRLCEPLSYLQFLALQQKATLVITDSGGIQEETTFLGVPCLTLRESTERPVTVTVGTNVIIGRDMDLLCREVQAVLNGKRKQGGIPPLWDGKAAERIAQILESGGLDAGGTPGLRTTLAGKYCYARIKSLAGSMRMYYRALILLLFASLAVAQTNPAPRPDVPSNPAEHQRHDDDDEPVPASAASVLPDSPVITIEGVCDRASAAAASSGGAKGESPAAKPGKEESGSFSVGSTASACETIVTKAQFENLVDALNPQMTAINRRQLAESYPRLLLFANKARELGLDQDPSFSEAMRFASIQLLTQRLNRYFEQQASSISDSDVEKYYKENVIKFERAELLRIFVPKQTRQMQNTGSGEYSGAAVDSPMLKIAEKIQVRAAGGEDFQQLQKEAFGAAGIPSGSPNVSTGKIDAARLPLDHQKVFEMQPGQVSDVIAESGGYYIYKVVSKEKVPLAQASKEIRKSIAAERVQDAAASLGKSVKSELDQKYFGVSPRTRHSPSGQGTSERGEGPPAK